jgi:phosphoglycerate kinase
MGLDVGPISAGKFAKVIERGRTIIWNGPLGVFEIPPFHEGSMKALNALKTATASGAITIVGGGETATFAENFGKDFVSHISTGGGASLELLEGKTLPGVAALSDI